MMNFFVQLVDAGTFIVATVWVYNTVKKICRHNNTVYFILIVFYMLFIVPVGIDVFITYPSYSTWTTFTMFNVSYNDAFTRIFYDIWILVAYRLILTTGLKNVTMLKGNKFSSIKKREVKNNSYLTDKMKNKWVVSLFFILGISPTVIVLLAKMPTGVLYIPFWLDNNIYSFTGTKLETVFYFLQKISYISIISCFLYIVNASHSNRIRKICMIFSIYMLTCLESKRAIYAVLILIITSYIIYNVDYKKRKYVLMFAFVMLVVLVEFCVIYMTSYRVYNINHDFVNTYTQIKMDFMRDDRVKAVIYSILNPSELRILYYPFQSYLTQIGSLFPLEFFWPIELVVSFNKYFTCALLSQPLSSGANWMTTSFFDEMCANFGFIGLLVAPVIIGKICIITDRYSNKIKVISIMGIVLLFMLNLGYISWFIQFWVAIMFFERKKIKIKFKIYGK